LALVHLLLSGNQFADLIGANEGPFGFLADFVEASAGDGFLARLGVTDGVVDPSGHEAQRRVGVELGQAPVLDRARAQ
jgi:hypothetical protein